MKSVKTYRTVNTQDELVSFAVSKLEDIYLRRKGKVDEPHRHNYYTIIIFADAQGKHEIDFNSYDLAPGQLYFVAPGQVHQVVESKSPVGFALTFSMQFLIENNIPVSFIDSLSLFQDYGQSPPLNPKRESFNRVQNYAKEMQLLFQSNTQMKELSIGALLKLLLIECNNICAMNPVVVQGDISKNAIIRSFKQQVDHHFTTEHSTSYYAKTLNISPDYLNRTIKSRLGKTAKEYIQSRLATEAKRLLYFSKLSHKEIGYELGFTEPANFSAFFKKETGLSPSKFKKKK